MENFSRSRVSLSPKNYEVTLNYKETLPISINDIIENYPAAEATNLQRITNIPPASEDVEQKNQENNPTDTPSSMDLTSSEPGTTTKETLKNSAGIVDKTNVGETDEFVIEKVISHPTDRSKNHQYATVG